MCQSGHGHPEGKPAKSPKKTAKTYTVTNYRLRKLQQRHRTGTEPGTENPVAIYVSPYLGQAPVLEKLNLVNYVANIIGCGGAGERSEQRGASERSE